VSIKAFGAFVQLEGHRRCLRAVCLPAHTPSAVALPSGTSPLRRRQGLVHISQLASQRVESTADVVGEGDKVKVKVLAIEGEKISLSMKAVDQQTGADLGGDVAPRRVKRRDDDEDVSTMTWGLKPLEHDEPPAADEDPLAPKIQPNFNNTGKLAEATNKVNGVTLKWSEPHDAMKPSKHWRLYVFKGKEELEPYHIHRQTAYLLGRERRVCDIPLDHPSCSTQHAVLQFRLTQKEERGTTTKLVRPYLLDLGSTNGSYVNGDRLEPERYVELLEKDVLRFGYSSREYVLLNADAKK